MSYPFFTVGHSTRSIMEFVDLLRPHKIKLVVDVRTIPRSRANAQYNGDEIARSLSGFQIDYEYVPALGGRRGRRWDVAPTFNGLWKNRSFHNYADYAMTDEFRVGLVRLRELGHRTPCATMCAEAVWWRCHRRIIADYLIAAGEIVFHILGSGPAAPAHLTPGAVIDSDSGTLSYPADIVPEAKPL
jgi:uncharacterized protein (DUF488 family)